MKNDSKKERLCASTPSCNDSNDRKGHNPKRTRQNLSGEAKEMSATFWKFSDIWKSVEWLCTLEKLKSKCLQGEGSQ